MEADARPSSAIQRVEGRAVGAPRRRLQAPSSAPAARQRTRCASRVWPPTAEIWRKRSRHGRLTTRSTSCESSAAKRRPPGQRGGSSGLRARERGDLVVERRRLEPAVRPELGVARGEVAVRVERRRRALLLARQRARQPVEQRRAAAGDAAAEHDRELPGRVVARRMRRVDDGPPRALSGSRSAQPHEPVRRSERRRGSPRRGPDERPWPRGAHVSSITPVVLKRPPRVLWTPQDSLGLPSYDGSGYGRERGAGRRAEDSRTDGRERDETSWSTTSTAGNIRTGGRSSPPSAHPAPRPAGCAGTRRCSCSSPSSRLPVSVALVCRFAARRELGRVAARRRFRRALALALHGTGERAAVARARAHRA